jgi:hypothetical protein
MFRFAERSLNLISGVATSEDAYESGPVYSNFVETAEAIRYRYHFFLFVKKISQDRD